MKKLYISLIKLSKYLMSDYSGYFKFIQDAINKFKHEFSKLKNNNGNFKINFENKIVQVNIFNSDIHKTKYDSGIGEAYQKNGNYFIDIYGDSSLNIDWYIDTFQHQMMHLCQLYFGYANKNQKKSWNKQKKQDYMQNFNQQIKIPFNEKLQQYYTDEDQFSEYLADAIRFFKSIIINDFYTKQQIIDMLTSNIWNDKHKLLKLTKLENISSVQSIYFIYFWNKKDKNRFNQIISRILKFI